MASLKTIPAASKLQAFNPSRIDSSQAFPGNYRLLNVGSTRCISYTSNNANVKRLCSWSCIADDQDQIWSIKQKLSQDDPSAIAFEYTNILEQPYRLDFEEVKHTITNQQTPSGTSSIPNSVEPPLPPAFRLVGNAPSPVSTIRIQPDVSNTFAPPLFSRTLVVSPRGAETSKFKLIPVSTDTFFIYSPETGAFIGDSAGIDGAPLRVANLTAYIQDIESKLSSNPKPRDVVLKMADELPLWTWKLKRDYSAPSGTFRIVHHVTSLALDIGSTIPDVKNLNPPNAGDKFTLTPPPLPLAATKVSAIAASQIWDLSSSIDKSATSSSILSAHAQNLSKSLQVIYVPSKTSKAAAFETPHPTPEHPKLVLLWDPATKSSLAVLNSTIVSVKLAPIGIDDLWELQHKNQNQMVPSYEDKLLRISREDVVTFYKRYGWLLWRIYPEAFAPPDGMYELKNDGKYLEAPVISIGSSIHLTVSSLNTKSGSTWWKIENSVDNGLIYQLIENYRSGHSLDSSNAAITGKRLGSKKDERWRIVKSGTSFRIQDYGNFVNGVSLVDEKITYGKPVLWDISTVEFLKDGTYNIINAANGLYLNTGQPKTPLHSTLTVSSWTLQSTSSGRSIKSASSALTVDSSGRAILGNNDQILKITKVEDGTFFIAIDGKFLNNKDSDDASSRDATFTAFENPPETARWRFISTSSLNESSWMQPSWTSINFNIPDGIYRIVNTRSKSYIESKIEKPEKSLKIYTLQVSTKKRSDEQWWYIQRKRDPKLPLHQQTYTITNIQARAYLGERVTDFGQSSNGLRLSLDSSRSNPNIWMIWKSSNYACAIQCVGSSGAFLDDGQVAPLTTPLLENSPLISQLWNLEKVKPYISSGFYKFQNGEKNYLSINGNSLEYAAYGKYGKTSDWKIILTSSGLYWIQSLADLRYLSVDKAGEAELSISHNRGEWCITNPPTGTGFALQNVKGRCGLQIDGKDYNFTFERIERRNPLFMDVPSDKIAPSDYEITNTSSQTVLAWPPAPSFGSKAQTSPKVTNSQLWSVYPSIPGFYSLKRNNYLLGVPAQSPTADLCASVEGLATSNWKLIESDSGNYRVVNKESGLALAISESGKLIQSDTLLRGEWSFIQSRGAPQYSNTREVDYTNGLYVFRNISSEVLALKDNSSPPSMMQRDWSFGSTSSRCQVWIVEKNESGWYYIKSFPFGLALNLSPGPARFLSCSQSDVTPRFCWKFIQMDDGKMRIVSRSQPDIAITSDLKITAYTGFSTIHQWDIQKFTDRAPESAIPVGTYIISLYIDVATKSAAIKAAKSAQLTYDADAYTHKTDEIETNLKAVSLKLKPITKAVDGVEVDTLKGQLQASGARESDQIGDVVLYLYGELVVASKLKATDSTKRTVSEQKALESISKSLVNYIKDGGPDPANVVNSIIETANATIIPTNTLASAIQASAASAGMTILDAIDTYKQTLPQPPPFAPETPPTITLNDFTATMTKLVPQSLSQYWLIETAGDSTYFISHLTTKKYLQYRQIPGGLDTVILSSTPSAWQISQSPNDGYIISLPEKTPNVKVLCSLEGSSNLNCISKLVGNQRGIRFQRWQLRRTGYYLQSQFTVGAVPNTLTYIATYVNGQVSLTTMKPFAENSGGIWHLTKVDTGKYRLYNEKSRTALRSHQDGDFWVTTAPNTIETDADLFQLAKNNDDLWLGCMDPKQWLAANPNSNRRVGLSDAGDKERWKGWQFVSVAATERGGLMALPRNAFRSGSDVWSVDGSKLLQYKFDDSQQRFRAYVFGKNTMYINESNLKVIRSDFTLTDLASVDDNCWFPSGEVQDFNIETNTGDLPSSINLVRIALPDGSALGLDGQKVIAAPWDRMDDGQLWVWKEWACGRYISHFQTRWTLSVSSSDVKIVPDGTSKDAIWTMDFKSTQAQNCYFPLRPFEKQLALRRKANSNSIVVDDTSQVCRFIPESTWLTITDRRIVLDVLIKTKMPVFVHEKIATDPISVDEYLLLSTFHNATTSPVSAATNHLPSGPDWILTYTANMASPYSSNAYISVHDARDARFLNYTDFDIFLLYPNHGWESLSMRFNNETNALDSVRFPEIGWIKYIDSNFSSLITPDNDNPLKIIKRENGITKLHVYVDRDLRIRPVFPEGKNKNEDIVKADNWAMSLDAGTGVVIDAGMIKDDEGGRRPVRPEWVDFDGIWVEGGSKPRFEM